MSLLRRVRAELSGAMRSVRYDLGRRPAEPPPAGPDMTSTGMSTFGGVTFPTEEERRPRRRAVLATALGVLTVVAAAGAYLGVVNGLGPMLTETPAAAGTLSPQPAVTISFAPNAGIGRGPARPAVRVAPTTPGPAAPLDPAAATVTPEKTSGNASPLRTVNTAKRECDCPTPPVPTPTAPATSTSTSPSGPPTDSPYPSGSADPSPSETSATPRDSAEPTDTAQARHHRWNR